MIKMTVKDVLDIPALGAEETRYSFILWDKLYGKGYAKVVKSDTSAEDLKSYGSCPILFFHVDVKTGFVDIEAGER